MMKASKKLRSSSQINTIDTMERKDSLCISNVMHSPVVNDEEFNINRSAKESKIFRHLTKVSKKNG